MPTETEPLTLVLAACTGLGLAAACGLRVFLPLLVLGAAVRAGEFEVAGGFEWVASTPALVALGVATLLEVGAFHLPFLDNLLDTVATPAAAVAGALAATSVLVGLDPWLQWSLGIVAGAGVATVVQVPTAAARVTSTASTGGTANPVLATGELLSASLVSGMAVFAPIAVPMVVIAIVAGAVHLTRKRKRDAASE